MAIVTFESDASGQFALLPERIKARMVKSDIETGFTQGRAMIGLQRIEVEGKRFVLLEEEEYERISREAGEAVADNDLPPLPKPDKNGRFPALQYARMSLARDLIRDRKGVGLSQQELADLAGIRQETLSRIETGKHTASEKTVDKIMRVIEAQRRKKKGRSGARKR